MTKIKEQVITKIVYTIEFEEQDLKDLFSMLTVYGKNRSFTAEGYFKSVRPNFLDLYKELELKFR